MSGVKWRAFGHTKFAQILARRCFIETNAGAIVPADDELFALDMTGTVFRLEYVGEPVHGQAWVRIDWPAGYFSTEQGESS